jgi:cytosine/adenosine deaminase-related metal-dependent hydrolase
MVTAGCRVALGLDGLALDEDDDALRELRLAGLLHGGTGFSIDVDRSALLAMAFANGRRAVLNCDDDAALVPGNPADVLVLDWDRIDDDRLVPDLDPGDLLFSRATAQHIDELIVAGKAIVRRGQVPGIDLPALKSELMDRLRVGIAQNPTLPATLSTLAHHVAASFDPSHACCW